MTGAAMLPSWLIIGASFAYLLVLFAVAWALGMF